MGDLNIRRDGAVTVLEIDRPAALNALNGRVIADLRDAVVGASVDPAVRAVVLTGSGTRAFSAGADLEELAGLDRSAATAVMERGQQAFRDIEAAGVPVIAAVNGLALGGGFELALACTLVLTSENASFGLPEAKLGLIPGYGGTQRLAPVIGGPTAAYLMLTGERLGAQRGYELGLSPLPPFAPEELVGRALGVAHGIAANGPEAVRSIVGLLGHVGSAARREALAAETAAAVDAIVGAESSEGIAAFRERRVATFPDRALGEEES